MVMITDYDEQKQDKWSFENGGDPVNPGIGGGFVNQRVQLTFLISPELKEFNANAEFMWAQSPLLTSKTRSRFRSFRNQEKSKPETLKE
ncbi:hypothetical protein GBA52_026337 [Prunus armeniaca]|nr:hypothetical protein GBA52_026337 [Prunus armeniaca]